MPRARPQFFHLSEAEVWKAMADNAGGAVEAEVTRLVAELTVRLMARAGFVFKLRIWPVRDSARFGDLARIPSASLAVFQRRFQCVPPLLSS